MDEFKTIVGILCCGFFAMAFLYVCARMITRAILRSIEEWKERKRNG